MCAKVGTEHLWFWKSSRDCRFVLEQNEINSLHRALGTQLELTVEKGCEVK